MTDETNDRNEQDKSIEEVIERPSTQVIVVNKQGGNLGLIALIAGITSIVFVFCCAPVAILLALTAIITGIIAKNDNQDYASIGIILGIIGLAVPMIFLLFFTGLSFVTPVFRTIFF